MTIPTFGGFAWHPWLFALVLATVSFMLYILARTRLKRAKDDWADAFFYSPSSKTKHRLRRQRWQERCWALLASTITCLVAAAVLYLIEGKHP